MNDSVSLLLLATSLIGNRGLVLHKWKRKAKLLRRSQWPSGPRRVSAADRLLGLRVRILPGDVDDSCDCCVFSGRGLCDGPIPRPEESYRLWCVIACDPETSRMWWPWPALGCCAIERKYCCIGPRISAYPVPWSDEFTDWYQQRQKKLYFYSYIKMLWNYLNMLSFMCGDIVSLCREISGCFLLIRVSPNYTLFSAMYLCNFLCHTKRS